MIKKRRSKAQKKTPSRHRKKQKQSKWKALLLNKKIIASFFLIIMIFFGYLYFQVTDKFEQRKWNLPSRIFSDAYPLYEGRPVTKSAINEKLQHLNYKKVSYSPKSPGTYSQKNNAYEVYLHNFDYPHEKFIGFPIRFSVKNQKISHLEHRDVDKRLPLVNLEPELITSIFDKNMEDRTLISLDKIPPHLIQAVISIEDERFYYHFGIDPIGIARAFFVNLKNMRVVQGGSTLTQQLVKNFFLHHRRTLGRKINELFMAIMIDLRYSKEEILESYLNEIYLGQRGAASISGVYEAAQHYFSKNISQLNLAEAALIAALIRSPGYYSPFRHPERAKNRRNLVLKKMLEKELVSKTQYEKALKEPLPKHPKKRSTTAPYFIEFVKAQLRENFSMDILESEGLRIFTTLEMNLQRAAEKSVKSWLDKVEKDYPKPRQQAQNGKRLEGALIAIEPNTGFVRAYVGGRNYLKAQFDHIRQAKRQPGSTFKPFVYLTALDPRLTYRTFTPASLLNDNPLEIDLGGQKYKPSNYDHSFHGEVRLRQALEKSYNVSTVWLGQQIGWDSVVETAKRAGIKSHLEAYPSLGLGAFEVTPMEMAIAYSVFPNQGVKTDPITIRRVVTLDGEILEKKSLKMDPVFSPDAVYLMNRILKGVVDQGTGASARRRGLDVLAAGKTGTTSKTRDAWFVGYTPDLLALSWVGYDDNSSTGLTGSSGALPIWTEFMKTATQGRHYQDFIPTKNIIIVPIDNKTGLLYDSSCGSGRMSEYFIEGTEPYAYCDEYIGNFD